MGSVRKGLNISPALFLNLTVSAKKQAKANPTLPLRLFFLALSRACTNKNYLDLLFRVLLAKRASKLGKQ